MGTDSKKKPVVLTVFYKTPQSLVGELTKSVGRGGARIESRRPLPEGTRFLFELRAKGLLETVEVCGTVMSVAQSAPELYVMHIRYELPPERRGIDSILESIFRSASYDVKRKHARIPLHVRAVEDNQGSTLFRIRDISRGGVGIDVESRTLPKHIAVGGPFLLQMKLSSGQLVVSGEVAWAVSTKNAAFPVQLGLAFSQLSNEAKRLLDDVVQLRALPAPPWIARLRFGPEALLPRIGRRHGVGPE